MFYYSSEIPRVSFANDVISHDMKNPKLMNILVQLSKKVVREFTVTVTPIHSDDVLAAGKWCTCISMRKLESLPVLPCLNLDNIVRFVPAS